MVVSLECGDLHCCGCIGAFICNSDQCPNYYLKGTRRIRISRTETSRSLRDARSGEVSGFVAFLFSNARGNNQKNFLFDRTLFGRV